ncbi:MAG: hypothetical protein ACRD2L_17210, partial [Terriglobia bacterium]
MISVRLLMLCCIVSVGVALPPPPQLRSQSQRRNRPAKEVYSGTAVAVGGQFGGASRPFTLEVAGYTPTEEVQQAFRVLRAQGQDDFMNAIKGKKLGFFAFDGQVGRDLNFILETQTETGRKITILFERWLEIFEIRYGTRSQDYPLAYIELFINYDGKGEGSLFGLAKVSFDKKNPNSLDIEKFGTYPAKLMGVVLRSQ